jgi:hypothetical protein
MNPEEIKETFLGFLEKIPFYGLLLIRTCFFRERV